MMATRRSNNTGTPISASSTRFIAVIFSSPPRPLPLVHSGSGAAALVMPLGVMLDHPHCPMSGDSRNLKGVASGISEFYSGVLSQAMDGITVYAHLAKLPPHHDAQA